MTLFIGGLFAGTVIGVIVMSLMAIAGSNSRREEMNDTIEWDDFKDYDNSNDWRYQQTNIKCPECGKLLVKDIGQILTTYPAKYKYECQNCGWFGVK